MTIEEVLMLPEDGGNKDCINGELRQATRRETGDVGYGEQVSNDTTGSVSSRSFIYPSVPLANPLMPDSSAFSAAIKTRFAVLVLIFEAHLQKVVYFLAGAVA